MSDAATTSTGPAAPSGERRQVTVLFADMVGFTAISERLGEEGTFALIQPIYELMAGAVKEQGGSVKDFTGDGIIALFGVPKAMEDGPLRACRAGLRIHERLAAALPPSRPSMACGLRRERRHDGARRHRQPRFAPASPGRAGNRLPERYDPDLSEDNASWDARFDAYYAAQATLMIAPAPLPLCVFHKWELFDHLMTDEIVNGPFTVKEALIALASIKADISRFGLKEE